MIYKTTSYKTIISKVARDFNLTGTNWVSSAVESMGEALEEIGHHVGLEKKSCKLLVTNHRAMYPCEHESTLTVEYNGRRLPRGGSLTYGEFNNVIPGSGFNQEAFPLVVDTETVNVGVRSINSSFGQYYLENPDYIITSFECGEIVLHYQAYLVDDEGFPKIPDSTSHREALAFYILYKYLSRGNKHTTWDLKSAYDMWREFRSKAQNRAAYPDIQQMDRFKNMWCRIVFDHNLPNKFFRGSENTQALFNV